MEFQEFLNGKNLASEYNNTKIELKYFWQAVEANYPDKAVNWLNAIYLPKPHYNLLNVLNKAQNIPDILDQLVANKLADALENTYQNYPIVLQAILESTSIETMHKTLEKMPKVCTTLNNLTVAQAKNLLKQTDFSDFAAKIEPLTNCRFILKYIVWGTTDQDIARGFINYLNNIPKEQIDKATSFYFNADGNIIKIIEQNIANKDLVMKIHQLIIGDNFQGDPILQAIAGLHYDVMEDRTLWQTKLANNFFTTAHTDLLYTIEKLILINSSNCLAGLLNLCAQSSQSGYGKLQYIIQRLIPAKVPHAIFKALEPLNFPDVCFVLGEMVWVNQTETFIAQKLVDFALQVKPEQLTLFLQYYVEISKDVTIMPHLIESIEGSKSSIYNYLCGDNIYIDLIQELQNLDVVSRNNLLNADQLDKLFPQLQFLSSTQTQETGYPFLIAGILKIGGIKIDVSFILKFLSYLYDEKNSIKNIAKSINVLGSRKATRIFVPYICDKQKALSFIGCDQLKDGAAKSVILIQAICSNEGAVKTLFIDNVLNQMDSFDAIEGLMYTDKQGNYRICNAFLNALEDYSTSQTLLENFNSFKLDGPDPYKFIQILEKIAPSVDQGTEYFKTLLKENPVARKALIKDIVETGQIEHLFLNIAKNSKASSMFDQLIAVKYKSPALYHSLLILCSRIDDPELGEFQNIIQAKMINTDTYGDIMEGFTSLQNVDGNQQIDYKKAIRFVQEIYNNPTFMEALHRAFDESIKEEAEYTVKIIQAVYDKANLINAIDQLSMTEAIVVIRSLIDASTASSPAMVNLIENLNNLTPTKCYQFLKNVLYRDPTNASFPISVCYNVLQCIKNISDPDIFECLMVKGMMNDWELALLPYNPLPLSCARSLMQQSVFMYILASKTSTVRQQLLRDIFDDTNNTITNFYLLYKPQLYLPLLVMYGGASDLDKIHEVRKFIQTDPDNEALFTEFTNLIRDPSAKFLSGVINTCITLPAPGKTVDLKQLHAFKDALDEIINLKKALIRFASRDTIDLNEICILLNYLVSEGQLYNNGTINRNFNFPSERFAVVEDAWMNQKLLEALGKGQQKLG